jgi:dolichyl-phosphate beta-glucosyltransferase
MAIVPEPSCYGVARDGTAEQSRDPGRGLSTSAVGAPGRKSGAGVDRRRDTGAAIRRASAPKGEEEAPPEFLRPSGAVAEYRWSVVIPAYNEAARLPRYLKEVIGYFDGRDEPYEVLVVDDGSGDGTAGGVRELRLAHPFLGLIRMPENRGKGRAVRAGMQRARGALRLMADADGATPIIEVERLEAAILGGADVAVGSRARPDPSVVRQTLVHRRLAGFVFNLMARGLGVRDVMDTQCGFKLFRGAVADDLFGALRTDGFSFDVELLLLARRRGYRVVEVGVNWADQPGSKVGVLRHAPGMLCEILAARWRLAVHARSGRRP